MASSPAAEEAATPSSSSSGPGAEDGVEEMTLTVRWSGREFVVRVCGDDSVGELKRRICEVTTVLPKRQKLLYPKLAALLGNDSLLISQLNLKPSVKMTMIGLLLQLDCVVMTVGDQVITTGGGADVAIVEEEKEGEVIGGKKGREEDLGLDDKEME